MVVKSLTPNLLVDDVSQSIEFYTQNLEFSFVMGVTDEKQLFLEFDKNQKLAFAIVAKDGVQIMFQDITNASTDLGLELKSDKNISNSIIYIEIDEFDSFYEKLKEKVSIVNEPRHTFYGMKEFYIKDNNENIVGFAEKLL
ncbi:MAG: bleomycin resistance family protein [Sulfurospirillum sp.]|nr:MAG: bleomycin resistance family protein [Sulfurospirillum sp.]